MAAARGPIPLMREAFECTDSLGSTTICLGILDNSASRHIYIYMYIYIYVSLSLSNVYNIYIYIYIYIYMYTCYVLAYLLT